jgi:flavin reductase (DIM6/NTAB) family NADH-FMN oxidoreductase RutF
MTRSSDPAAFRRAMALLVTGVTVVTARDPVTGEPRGMTANAVMSVSLEPPLILVSVRNGARMHETVRLAGAYAVTVLSAGQESHARHFAGLPIAGHNQGQEPEFTERAGVPVLQHGLAWAVADVMAAHQAGDHTLFVGQVTAIAAERALDPPLAFHRSAFTQLVTSHEPAWDGGLDTWG